MSGNDERTPDTKEPRLSEEAQDDRLLDEEGIAADAEDVVGAQEPIVAPAPAGRDAESHEHERRAKRRRRKPKSDNGLPDDLAEPLAKLKTKDYLELIMPLHVELLKFENWVKDEGPKIVALFEGRDAAGKGGTIKRFVEHMNPRGCRVVALQTARRRSGTSSATWRTYLLPES